MGSGYFIEESEKGQKAYRTQLTENRELLAALSNELALEIVRELGKEPGCARDLARRLDQHEQKIYYHIRKLDGLGAIKLIRTEKRAGAFAKIYSPTSSIISFKLYPGNSIEDKRTRARELEFLRPFVEDGRFNSIVVIGSPDPHGKYKSPASDGYCAINLSLFLGQFISDVKLPYYKLDTQVRDKDLENNMILVGGPKANIICDRINKDLPIYFDYSAELADWSIISSLSKTVYRDKHVGIIVRVPSPFSSEKEVLLFSGKGFRGTRAAVLGFTKHLDEVEGGNSLSPEVIAKVVKGVDVDSDGIVDEIEFLE